MYKSFVLVLLTGLLEEGLCENRDQRYLQPKIEVAVQLATNIEAEINGMEPITAEEKEILSSVAIDFARDLAHTVSLLERGVINNTRNNEHGKALNGILLLAYDFKQWVNSNLNDKENNLFSNFKVCLAKVGNLVPAAKASLPYIKESTYNNDLGVSAWLDTVDNTIYSFTKIYYQLKLRKYTNNQLRENINEALEDVNKSLNQIAAKKYNAKEMAAYVKQLNYQLGLLTDKLNNWLDQSKFKQNDSKKPLEQTNLELQKLIKEIQLPDNAKASTIVLKGLYKKWLSNLSEQVNKLDAAAHEYSSDIAKAVLIDTVGIENFYRTVFGIISGNLE